MNKRSVATKSTQTNITLELYLPDSSWGTHCICHKRRRPSREIENWMMKDQRSISYGNSMRFKRQDPSIDQRQFQAAIMFIQSVLCETVEHSQTICAYDMRWTRKINLRLVTLDKWYCRNERTAYESQSNWWVPRTWRNKTASTSNRDVWGEENKYFCDIVST